MAALQKIRSKGAWLILAIGLGLFAFIAGDFFQSVETTRNVSKMQVGEVYGEDLSVQEYQALVEQTTELYKMQYGTINDAMQDQIRDEVWNQYVSYKLIEHEASKLGMIVTDQEIQDALVEGTATSLLRMGQPFVGQNGRFDVVTLQNFLKQYKELASQTAQLDPQMVESFQMMYRIWEFTEKELRKELLMTKFNVLMQQSIMSNSIAARMQFDERNTRYTAQVAAIPFSSIDDKKVEVTDAELKAMYEKNKELFRVPFETRDLKYIDVLVSASNADRAALNQEMADYATRLQSGENIAATVAASKTTIPYVDAPLSKNAFARDIQSHLDSMAVGSVKAPFYSAIDNTMNTIRLISKAEMPDSVQYCMIAVQAATAEEVKQRADSIATAVAANDTAFAAIAKKYQQNADSIWVTSAQYEGSAIDEDGAKFITALNTTAPGQITKVEMTQGTLVLKVIARKKMVTKYNAAIIKCPVDFSKDTYQNALNQFNRFISANRTLEAIEKNAGKSGYVLRDLENFSSSMHNVANVGATKDAIRWIFDEAEVGDISKLYECGTENDHLLLIAVTGVHEQGYRPWDEKNTKEVLRLMVLSEKKGEMLRNQLKNVKNMATALKQPSVVSDTLKNVTFMSNASVLNIGAPEPALTGLICKTPAGKFSTVIGSTGAYMVQGVNAEKPTEKFDAKMEMQMAAQNNLRTILGQLYQALVLKADIVDNRYKF